MTHTIVKGNDLLLKLNHQTISYDDLGESALPVIFIHGFPFDKSMWQPQMDYLKNQYRVIAYDLRGFGKSTVVKEKASIHSFAEDLIRFMDVLQIEKAIGCGLSMGGYILLNLMPEFQDRFAAIILADTQCNADNEEAKTKRFDNIKHIMAGGMEDYIKGSIEKLCSDETLSSKDNLIEKIRNMMNATSPLVITGTLYALAKRKETCSLLSHIHIPALVLCGKEDKITPVDKSEFLHDNIPDSTLHVINGAGHLSNLEQSDEFNHQLEKFIARVSLLN
jgi:3-oxoadipate enol-lactonase